MWRRGLTAPSCAAEAPGTTRESIRASSSGSAALSWSSSSRVGSNRSSLFRKVEAEKDDTRDRPGREPKEAEPEEAEGEEEKEQEQEAGKEPGPCSPRDEESGPEGSKGSVEEQGSTNSIKLFEGKGCTAVSSSLFSSSQLSSFFSAGI